MGSQQDVGLLDASSAELALRHPTSEECSTIWTKTSASWKDSLTLPLYIEEAQHLANAPLAKDGGMTTWILTEKDLPPGQRRILSSCESYRKQAIVSNAEGYVQDGIVHGIASVFCFEEYRGRGYPKRMMLDLAKELYRWQNEGSRCLGSMLYSDIGKTYYAKLGWRPNASNLHIELPPSALPKPDSVQGIRILELADLCRRDEVMLRSHLAVSTKDFKTRVAIIPDLDHMLWHTAKEDFSCNYLFGKTPQAKGAIVGSPGNQVWAVWTHRYYSDPNSSFTANVLYILRLVVEGDETATRVPSDAEKLPAGDECESIMRNLSAILIAAQAEAAEWKLDVVKLWDPTPLVLNLLKSSGITYDICEREEEGISSALWYYDQGEIAQDSPLLVNNEHYAWC